MKRASAVMAFVAALGAMAGSAFADRLFAVDGSGSNSSSLYELDPTTGAIISTIGATGFSHVTGLAFNPVDGQLYGWVSGGTGLISINLTTGAGTTIGSGFSSQIPDMTFSSGGVLYAWTESNDTLATIDLTTGVMTSFGSNIGTSNTGLAFAPNGTLYLKPGSTLYTLDPTTGNSITSIGLSQSLNNMLAFDSSGTLFSGVRGGGFTLVTIDPTTGTVTTIGSNSAGNISALAFQPVPEPASVALMGLGVLALGGYVRRRRRASAKSSN